jgi:hypothetical protein
MKAFALFLSFGLLGTAVAQQCPGSWYLEPDDCICMNSRDGSLLKTQTLGCCKSMGYKTYDNVSALVHPGQQHLLMSTARPRSAPSTATSARPSRTAARA